MKKIISLLIAVTMTFSLLPMQVFALINADNTDDVVSITSSAGINDIRNNLAGHYRLDADIDLSTYEWIPIGKSSIAGNEYTAFTGTFDGNGHTISGLTINAAGVEEDAEYFGLFAYVKDAEIKNIELSNVNITGNASYVQYVGAIAGYSDNTKYYDCTINGFAGKDFKNFVGGIAGVANNSSVIDCCNVLNATITNAGEALGGISALVWDNSVVSNSTVSNSAFTLSLENGMAGGIVQSLSESEIKDCVVSNTSINSFQNGGIVFDATMISYITRCAVRNTTFAGSYTGGIVYNANRVSINDCRVQDTIFSSTYAGGISYYVNNTSVKNFIILGNTTFTGNYTDTAIYSSLSYGDDVSSVVGAYYENTIIAINNTDITSTTSATLKSGNTLGGFSRDNWTFSSGEYPYIKGEKVNVIFKDAFGNVIKNETLNKGQKLAQSTQAPQRTGYTFLYWIKDDTTRFDENARIYFDAVVTAVYRNETTSYIQIYTAEEFNNIRNNLSGRYRLEADIDLSSFENWIPIGKTALSDNEYTPFTGVLNGNGHSISNVKMDTTALTGKASYFGIFAGTNGADIRNITVNNVTLNANITDEEDIENLNYTEYVGAISGVSVNTYFNNCIVNEFKTTNVEQFSGAITASATENSKIVNSKVTSSDISGAYAGGIVGELKNSQITGSSVARTNFRGPASGGIAGTATSSNIKGSVAEHCIFANAFAGGIVANAHSTQISECVVKNATFSGIRSGGAVMELNENSFLTSCAVKNASFIDSSCAGIVFEIDNSQLKDCYLRDTEITGEAASAVAGKINSGAVINNIAVFGSVTLNNDSAIAVYTGESENISNVYYENTIVAENSDNAEAVTAQALKSGSPLNGFSTDTWLFAQNEYPCLKFETVTTPAVTSYVVKFIFEDEENPIAIQNVIAGRLAHDVEAPEKEGEVFCYWSENRTTPFDFESKIYDDITLYAVYRLGDVAITITGIEDEIVDTVEIQKNSEITSEVKAEIDSIRTAYLNASDNYKFVEYRVDGEANELIGMTVSSPIMVKIIADKYYKVTFMSKGQTEAVDVKKGETVAVPSTISTTPSQGQQFLGWFAGDVEYNFNTPVNNNMLIEAKFGTMKYNVIFYQADSFNPEENAFDYFETSKEENVEYGSRVTAPEAEHVPEGYEFVGWSESAKLNSVTSNLYVYARYEKIVDKATVYFYAHREGDESNTFIRSIDVEVGTTLRSANYPGRPNYTGYTFTAWDKTSVTVTDKNASYIVIAEYRLNSYTVKFVDEGSTSQRTVKYNQMVGTAPEARGKTGYIFTGWSDGTNTFMELNDYRVTKNVTFTALYTAKIATNFILYDELKGEAVFGIEVPSETLVPSSVNEIRSVYESYTLGTVTDGYKFIGWFDKNGNEFNFNNEIVERYSIAYAKYEVVKVAPLADAMQTISATQDLNAAIAQANAIGGTSRVEISLTTDAKITGMVDLTRANVTINGNGHTVTGISTSSASGGLRIKADGLMLKDITWDTSSNKAWAMRVLGSFTIYFDGIVNVKSASGYAGIHVTQDTENNDVTATFIGVTNDAVLNVTGGQSATAIGSSNAKDSKSGKLVFRAGTFNLTGGLNAAAIGGAARGSANDVIIRGNYVFEGSTEPIKLVVNANGGKYGAAIGTGYLYSEKNKTFGKLTVSDGAVVNAKAGQTGAAFGSGKRTYDPRGERATISGEETAVNFFSSTVAGFKDGIVELRGGTFFSLTQLNQGMMISGNEEKVLRINATNSTPKSQNIVAYTNKFMQNYKTEYLGRIRLAFADSNGEEYGATDTQVTKLVGKIVLRTTSSTMSFNAKTGDSAISRAISLSTALENMGYKLNIAKQRITFAR